LGVKTVPKRLIWLDFVILVKTVRVVLRGKGCEAGEEFIDT